MDLSEIRKTLEDMSDEELMQTLQGVRQNRRTPAPRTQPTAKAKTSTPAKASMSLDALLASAKNDPAVKAALLAQLTGGKK
jgi:hypothetical protein